MVWPQLAATPLVDGLDHPTQVTNAGDGSGRLFVVEQRGTVRIIKNGDLQPEIFLDISDRVSDENERGFLSIAFPPQYAGKGYFYATYTALNGDVVLARFHVTPNPDLADASQEAVILRIPHPGRTHNGGQLAFSPRDGYLYMGVGDGGSLNDPQRRAENPQELLGKILRIDVEGAGGGQYAVPPSNPYVDQRHTRPEIWARGLRNPWRFTFDRQTGDLYIADVGETQYEEVDFQPAASLGGQDYGWNTMEGLHCFYAEHADQAQHAQTCRQPGLQLPVMEYPHTEGKCAIAGGTVYRGQRFPRMFGLYFYGDFCTGRLYGLQYVNDRWQSMQLEQIGPFSVAGFGEDENGDLYLVDNSGGRVYSLADRVP